MVTRWGSKWGAGTTSWALGENTVPALLVYGVIEFIEYKWIHRAGFETWTVFAEWILRYGSQRSIGSAAGLLMRGSHWVITLCGWLGGWVLLMQRQCLLPTSTPDFLLDIVGVTTKKILTPFRHKKCFQVWLIKFLDIRCQAWDVTFQHIPVPASREASFFLIQPKTFRPAFDVYQITNKDFLITHARSLPSAVPRKINCWSALCNAPILFGKYCIIESISTRLSVHKRPASRSFPDRRTLNRFVFSSICWFVQFYFLTLSCSWPGTLSSQNFQPKKARRGQSLNFKQHF